VRSIKDEHSAVMCKLCRGGTPAGPSAALVVGGLERGWGGGRHARDWLGHRSSLHEEVDDLEAATRCGAMCRTCRGSLLYEEDGREESTLGVVSHLRGSRKEAMEKRRGSSNRDVLAGILF